MFNQYLIYMSSATEEKLLNKIRPVSYMEVEEAFYNWSGIPLIDDRKNHKTKPPTVWFISETCENKTLKIVGIFNKEMGVFNIKTAFDPDEWEVKLYASQQ